MQDRANFPELGARPSPALREEECSLVESVERIQHTLKFESKGKFFRKGIKLHRKNVVSS